jgi:hypothetical protein
MIKLQLVVPYLGGCMLTTPSNARRIKDDRHRKILFLRFESVGREEPVSYEFSSPGISLNTLESLFKRPVPFRYFARLVSDLYISLGTLCPKNLVIRIDVWLCIESSVPHLAKE